MALFVAVGCSPGASEIGIYREGGPEVSEPTPDAASDAPVGDSGGTSGSGTAGTAGTTGTRDAGTCAWANANPTRSPPTVWFVIDASYGTDGTSEGTFYKRTRQYIVGSDGFPRTRDAAVRFGAVFHGDDPESTHCPTMSVVEPSYDNLSNIEAAYPSATLPERRDGQAGYALERVLAWTQQHPPALGSQVVILTYRAIDGAADYACGTGRARVNSVPDALTSLLDLGVRTFVFTPSRNIPTLFPDLVTAERAAELGGTETPLYYSEEDDLGAAFEAVVTEAVSCNVSLKGEVKDLEQACQGEVRVDGTLLGCNDPDGWRLVDASTVELTGQACEQVRADPEAQIEARFPCQIFVELI